MERTEIQVVLYSSKRDYYARGLFFGSRLTVLQGSRVSDTVASSADDRTRTLRRDYVDQNSVLLRDLTFTSPSSAGMFVTGRSCNGWVSWTTPDGTQLDHFRNMKAGQPRPEIHAGTAIPPAPAVSSAETVTQIQPASGSMHTLDFDHIQDLSFTRPTGFAYSGSQYRTRNWSDLYIQAMKVLCEHHRELVDSLLDRSITGSRYVTFASEANSRYMWQPARIAENVYVNSHGSATALMRHLGEALLALHEDDDALIVTYIRNEAQSAEPVRPAGQDVQETLPQAADDIEGAESGDGNSRKLRTENMLRELIADDRSMRIESKERHTTLYFQDKIVASIYYRADAVRIEMRDTPAVHALYEELRSESLAYQKPSAGPHAAQGKYTFFVSAENEETVFLAILIAVQDRRLEAVPAAEKKPEAEKPAPVEADSIHRTENPPAASAPPSVPQNTEEPSREASGSIKQEPKQTPPPPVPRPYIAPPAPARKAEDSGRIEKKLDSLLGVIANMYSGKAAVPGSEAPEKEEPDRRFRLEPAQSSAPVLILRKPAAITGLIFALKLCAVGVEGCSEPLRVFFANDRCEPLSGEQLIEVKAGEEYTCRFELKSSASEEKSIYLAVQSAKAAANEARQLIEFPVKIAFAADFGL